MEISARQALGGGGSNVLAWERVIGGRRYWFNATPYEVKVFRLRLDGGDLVHHWRDVPETVGEYDRYDKATYPAPGQIAWGAHWAPNSAERVYYSGCRVCRQVVEVTREQLVAHHEDGYGGCSCEGSGSAATLKAARVRDDRLNVTEEAVLAHTSAWLTSCRGFQTLSDGSKGDCHHPVCHKRLEDGLRWTLMGWKLVA
ncbi:hypothetical protein ACGFZB_28910 [Streptomyces cinerochromogenes]|uniref:Uncharacterized protein n=1 Tax=Streptomyces cinerochromogenes TaxID=66422 RepID=A0ABW7BAY8_9ACTN